MLRKLVFVSRRAALLPAPRLLPALATQCSLPQLAWRGLAKKAGKDKGGKDKGKGGKKGQAAAADDDDDDDENEAETADEADPEGPDLEKLAQQMERSFGLLQKGYLGMQASEYITHSHRRAHYNPSQSRRCSFATPVPAEWNSSASNPHAAAKHGAAHELALSAFFPLRDGRPF